MYDKDDSIFVDYFISLGMFLSCNRYQYVLDVLVHSSYILHPFVTHDTSPIIKLDPESHWIQRYRHYLRMIV